MAAASKSRFEGDLDRLYQLPLSEFTAARDELVKRLRAQGERERAQELKTLRKPTAVVWLVNQLGRERPLDVQRLLKAGEALTKSQAKAVAGKSQTLSEARRDEQRALDQLATAAREIAERAGIGSPAVGKATETLRAASLTAEGRELLRRGRLTEKLEPLGFEALTGLEGFGQGRAPAKAKPKSPRGDDRAKKQQALKEARERVRQLREEERGLATAARAAAREAERVEAEAETTRNRAAEAQEKARAASEQRRAAEADLGRLA